MTAEPEVVVRYNAIIGEGVIWDEKKQILYWVDITGKKVFIYNPRTGENRGIDVGHDVGTIVVRESGGVMLAVNDGFASLDTESEELKLIADPESDMPNNRFNDGKCDPAGRFWAGTMSYDKARGAGSLYRMDTDMSVHRMVDNVTISNGIVWSLDNRILYFIDSVNRTIDAFDYDQSTGNISNRRVAVSTDKKYGFPDGMALDEEGLLWVAHFGGGCVCRWNPDTGELAHKINIPQASQTTACTFGGDNFNELYITSACEDMTDEDLKGEPLAGSLFKVDVDVKGAPTFAFQG